MLRIPVKLSKYASLAQHLADADDALKREFADLTLEALLNAYREEVQLAARERPKTAEQRKKILSWRRGTEGLIARLQLLRLRLREGGALALHIDHQQQVMILVDGQAVVVSGPRVEIEPSVEREVVERFCAVNDCSWVETPEEVDEVIPARPEKGIWALRQGEPPTYQIGESLHCRFGGLANRDEKERRCHQAADELRLLASALRQARDQGHRIEWDRLTRSRSAGGLDLQVVLNSQGAFVRLPLPLLAVLHVEDWSRVVKWLRRAEFSEKSILSIKQADLLLKPRVE